MQHEESKRVAAGRKRQPLTDSSHAVGRHDRRRILAVGTGAAAAVILASSGRTNAARVLGFPYVRPKPPRPLQGPHVPFQEPPVVSSQNGVLSYTMNIVGNEKEIVSCTGAVFKDVLRTYNGLPVGATFKVRRGDTLLFRMVNELRRNACNPDNFDNCCSPDEPSVCCDTPFDHNKPHCFNTTNLHTHGLHVSPAAFLQNGELIASDEVLLEVEPGDVQRYCIQLPEFHAPGTYWYHAHRHGSVAIQLSSGNGLCGALIIEEDADEQILKPHQVDRVWVIQEQLGEQASLVYTCLPPSFQSLFTVNALFQPTLRMRPGEVQRWRFINATATPRGFGLLQLLDGNNNAHPMHLIAVDGITFYGRAPQPKTSWQLAPGGRADFLVRIPPTTSTGFFKVRKAADPQVFSTVNQDLAYVVLVGSPLNDQLPNVLPQRPARTCYLAPIFDAELKPDIVDFGIMGGACGGQSCIPIPQVFTIQGAPFDPHVVNHQAPLGAVQEWQLANNAGSLHPFHIHLNPFQVVNEKVDPAGPNDPTNWMWRDTVAVPTSGVNMRTRFLTYDGKYVLHCHILNHEDHGMMQIVQAGNTVYDPATGARISGDGVGPCQKVETCTL